MPRHSLTVCLSAFVMCSCLPAVMSAETDVVSDESTPGQVMAARIDQLLADAWRELGVTPSPIASDSEFMRRAYLDLTGIIPKTAQAREFIADQRPDKRARLIDRLLQSPAHPTHMAATWRNIMLPRGFDEQQLSNAVGLEKWLREQFVNNMRYDRIVADFLISNGGDEIGPALFYTSQELKPEKLAASTAKIFLGLQIECAQCHDHPFDRWKQTDFWGYAAFFARLNQPGEQPQGRIRLVDLPRGEVKLPDTQTVVDPRYPGADDPANTNNGTRRMQLAIWLASRDNPYLARAAVNRAWADLFGRGLVEPVDDLRESNPASHPELLDELAEFFIKIRFDTRELYRTLANTRAYQRSSRTAIGAPEPAPETFARMAVKTMTAEELYDSLNRSLGRQLTTNSPDGRVNSRLFDPRRRAFIAKIHSATQSRTDFELGIPQALTLMNGTDMAAATDPEQGGLLVSLQAPWLDETARIESLFLATLSRLPTEQEQTIFEQHLRSQSDSEQRRRAMGEALWALLNSVEFITIH